MSGHTANTPNPIRLGIDAASGSIDRDLVEYKLPFMISSTAASGQPWISECQAPRRNNFRESSSNPERPRSIQDRTSHPPWRSYR